jgi:hypothetical protein
MKTHAIRIASIALGLFAFATATAGFSMGFERAHAIRMHELAEARRQQAIRAEIHREHREMRGLQTFRVMTPPVMRVTTPMYRVTTPVMTPGGGCSSHRTGALGW